MEVTTAGATPTALAALDAVRAAIAPVHALGDDPLVAETQVWEQVARVVQGRQLALAAEFADRSRFELGAGGLSSRLGCGRPEAWLADALLLRKGEAKRRIRLGGALAASAGLDGSPIPSAYPNLLDAVTAGTAGLAGVEAVLRALEGLHGRVAQDLIDAAQESLAAEAAEVAPDLLQVEIVAWTTAIDPDGVEPTEQEQRRRRCFRVGMTGGDGMTPFSGLLPPEDAAVIRGAIHAHRTAGLTGDLGNPDHPDAVSDSAWRSRQQWDYDIVRGILSAGLGRQRAGVDGVQTLHETVVHVSLHDLQRRTGAGWVEGIGFPIGVPSVERALCTGTTRLLVTGDAGEALFLGRRNRLFTRAQKRAITARDGACVWPGCAAAPAGSDVHHVRFWSHDGPTDVDNGVLLCQHHHTWLHSHRDREIRMHLGLPYIVPAGQTGPPAHYQRVWSHPIAAVREHREGPRPPRRM